MSRGVRASSSASSTTTRPPRSAGSRSPTAVSTSSTGAPTATGSVNAAASAPAAPWASRSRAHTAALTRPAAGTAAASANAAGRAVAISARNWGSLSAHSHASTADLPVPAGPVTTRTARPGAPSSSHPVSSRSSAVRPVKYQPGVVSWYTPRARGRQCWRKNRSVPSRQPTHGPSCGNAATAACSGIANPPSTSLPRSRVTTRPTTAPVSVSNRPVPENPLSIWCPLRSPAPSAAAGPPSAP